MDATRGSTRADFLSEIARFQKRVQMCDEESRAAVRQFSGRQQSRAERHERTPPLTAARGHVHKIEGVRAVPTFHPRFLLDRPSNKALAWRDLLLLMEEEV